MKKIFLTSVVALGVISSAQASDGYYSKPCPTPKCPTCAVTVCPGTNFYVSGKASYAWTKLSDTSMTVHTSDVPFGLGMFLSTDTISVDDETYGSIRGKVAVGMEMPATSLRGDFRLETEFGFGGKKKLDVTAGNGFPDDPAKLKLGYNTFFVNGYYDFHATEKIKPYVGAGMGLAYIKGDINWSAADPANPPVIFYMNESESYRNFGYNLGAGLVYDLTQNIALDLGYRYTDLGKVILNTNNMVDASAVRGPADLMGGTSVIKTSLNSHEVLLGMKYTF